MAEEIIIGIKTSTTLTPVPVDVGLHDLLDYEWKAFLERETKSWEENLKLFTQRKGGGTGKPPAVTGKGKAQAVAERPGVVASSLGEQITIEETSPTRYGGSRYGEKDASPPREGVASPWRERGGIIGGNSLPGARGGLLTGAGGDECCGDQFALAKSLQGLLGQRLEGIVQVELSWKVWNAPEDSRVNVLIKEQLIHQAPYQHYASAQPQPGALVTPSTEPQSYPLAVNQPHEGSLIWTVNDHAPAIPADVGDYIEFVVEVRRGKTHLTHESVSVLMPRARP